MPETAQPQDGKSEQDQGEIARIEPEGSDGQGEAKEGLHGIGQDRDRKQEGEIHDCIKHLRDKPMAENAVMFQPEPADETERPDDGKPAGGVKDVFDPRRHIEPRGEERQTETENQITESLQPRGEAFMTSLNGPWQHIRTVPRQAA